LRLFYFFLPAVLFAGIIFAISSLSYVSVPKLGIHFEDKLLHALEYFIFGFLLVRALYFGKPNSVPVKLLYFAVFIGLLYGASDEFHQYFVPGRTCEFWDWLADAIGVVSGSFVYRQLHALESQVIQLAKKTL